MKNRFRGVIFTVALLSLNIYFSLHCGSEDDNGGEEPQTDRKLGTLELNPVAASLIDEDEGASYGTVYRGFYKSADDFQTEVYFSIREQAQIDKVGVEIQGGTGTQTKFSLNGDEGAHKVWVSVGYRGSSEEDITKERECALGENFVNCLKGHSQYSRINPKLNAQDIADILRIVSEEKAFIVNGQEVNSGSFFPAGSDFSSYNFHTTSFGGVLFGYLLEDKFAPKLHNVILEQVTSPNEYPISEGPVVASEVLNTLFTACEEDSDCNATYPSLGSNFTRWMKDHAENQMSINGEMVYASEVFEHITHFISEINEGKVVKAVHYIGDIANAYRTNSFNSSTAITTAHKPAMDGYSPFLPLNLPRSQYGFPDFRGSELAEFLRMNDFEFFPGITNRTAMICSFGINREDDPDSRERFNSVVADERYAPFAYGFLTQYHQYLDICPLLKGVGETLRTPDVSGVEANAVIIHHGNLDIKHTIRDANVVKGYFREARLMQHKFLAQAAGYLEDCLRESKNSFWRDPNSVRNCEQEQNSIKVSQIPGW